MTSMSLAEQTGGSPQERDLAEAEAIAQLRALLDEGILDVSAQSETGQTLLACALPRGYAFAVKWWMANMQVIETLESADTHGLTPYQYAVFPLRQTLQGCHPVTESAFVRVPYPVVLPYLADRAPYPKTMALLEKTGADTDLTALRRH